MNRVGGVLFLVFGLLLSSSVAAAPCSGFNDVDSTSGFCANVDWLKNRGITLGCGPSLYCPEDYVPRIQMAAFMNRLGNALEPQFVHMGQFNIAAAVNSGSRVCITSVFGATDFPRVVSPVGAMLSVTASNAGSNFTALLQYSTNGGTTWLNWSSIPSTGGSANNVWSTLAPTANAVTVNAGSQLTFAINTGVLGGAVAVNATCELTVRIDSHTGSSAPF